VVRKNKEREMNKEWVVIFHAAGIVEASIVKGKLESESIPVILEQEVTGSRPISLVYGSTATGQGEAKLLVPASFEKQALQIISLSEKHSENKR
jgi:hypothetical protein